MIWALLFSLIFGNNEPIIIFPHLDKQIKKIVDDRERKDEILELIKTNNKFREKNIKQINKFRKEFNKKITNTSTSPEDFSILQLGVLEQREEYQLQNIEYIIKVKSLINADEWDKIIRNGDKDIKKEIKRISKKISKLEKKYSKSYKIIESRLKQPNAKNEALEIVKKTHSTHKVYLNKYVELLENKKSIMYQFELTEEELVFELNIFNSLYNDIFNTIINGHEQLVKLIHSKDLKRINKQIPDF